MPTLKWDIDKCLEQCSPAPLSNPPFIFKERPKRLQRVTFVEIRKAYNQIAKIIALHGEQYLPLFERLHTEITEYRERKELLNIATKIGGINLSTDDISNN
ncbi:MAG: hypothetical protein COB14_03120 [Alphaproteobacteria bacterium]|nr:MAG: hypothetical protein COB14_03120 [Alphaproteobacteria bacterium]